MAKNLIFKTTAIALAVGAIAFGVTRYAHHDSVEADGEVSHSAPNQKMSEVGADMPAQQQSGKMIVKTTKQAELRKLPDVVLDAPVPKGVRFDISKKDAVVSDRMIIRVTSGSGLAKALKTYPAEVEKKLSGALKTNVHVVRVAGDTAVLQFDYTASAEPRNSQLGSYAKNLMNIPGVAGMEEDVILHPAYTVNDPMYLDQWHLNKGVTGGANVSPAWDKTTGVNTSSATPNVIAVLDTGITLHQDLVANVLPGYDFITDPIRSGDGNGWDSDAKDAGDGLTQTEINASPNAFSGCRVQSSSWHGTHVAGIAAAVGNNATGVIGVAPNARILPVRVLGKCGGYMTDIAEGIRWAAGLAVDGTPVNPNPAKVINMSVVGVLACPSYLQSAITDAVKTGAAVVVAAGNSAADARNFAPANCSGVIVVGSVGQTGERAYYSNFGSKLAISAPGGDYRDGNTILSTLNSGTAGPGADTYGQYQGTSMAAPVVSGGIALAMAANPKMSPSAALTMLTKTASAFPAGTACAIQKNCGVGIVDIGKAVGIAETLVPDVVVSKFAPVAPVLVPNVAFDVVATLTNIGTSATPAGQAGKVEIYVAGAAGESPVKVGEGAIADVGGIASNAYKQVKISGLKVGAGTNINLQPGGYTLFAKFVGGDWESRADNNVSKAIAVDLITPQLTLTRKAAINQVPVNYQFVATFNDSRMSKVALGGDWVYEWIFTDGQVVKALGQQALLHVTNAGSEVATLKLKHTPSGFTVTATNNYDSITPEPSKVTFTETASNAGLRAPVTIRFSPSITTGHPLDRVASINWDVDNGQATSKTLNTIVTFNAGTHVVKATATTKMGYSASFEKTYTVVENKAPTCSIDYSTPSGQQMVVFTARCTDPDGVIKGVNWIINGRMTATPVGNPWVYKFPTSGSGTLNVIVRATDDSKGVGEAQVTVAY